MGVTGLWRLIEPSGKPVPVETLDNKVLAVDVSIWLHQAIKGFQTSEGGALQNAHLLGIYHRICKLLYFGIRPVLVFDGGVPNLKKETIHKRNQTKLKKLDDVDDLQKQIIATLLKHTAVNSVALENNLKIAQIAPKPATKETKDDIYKLPPTDFDITPSDDEIFNTSPTKHWDLHTIDEKSPHFKALPADVRHDILTELKETRKQSSWGKIHEMPKQSDDFSSFQMKRLLKRNSVQVSLEEAENEMGGRSLSLAELETLLQDQGVVTSNDALGNRIASNENTKYLLIKNVKKAMDEARKQAELETIEEKNENVNGHDEKFQKDLKKAIELSIQDVPSTSKETEKNKYSFLESFNDLDFQSSSESEDESCRQRKKIDDMLASAKSYMMEYSGLTPNEIAKIISGNTNTSENQIKECTDVIVKTIKKDNKLVEVIPISTYSDGLQRDCCSTDVMNRNQTGNGDILEEDLKDNGQKEKCDNIEITSNPDSLTKFEEKQKAIVEITIEPADELKYDKEKCDAYVRNDTQTEECDVEVISSASSDSLDDFIDVSMEPKAKRKSVMEIIVKPEEKLEDDLFNDIFSISEKDADVPIHAKNKENSNPETIEAIKAPAKERLTKQKLEEMGQQLGEEMQNLISERLSKERSVNGLTDQIYEETQELLHLFGVPYVMAPMEAEAQCAFMDFINLTDGTITDDSDIWLFGGKTVYKNFFNQKKYVMEYKAENIERHFKLSREQMILLALLVGSDYTIGISGIGPVTALEVLAAFPSFKSKIENENDYQSLITGLGEFRKWLMNDKPVGYGKTALRNKLKNVTCIESFPSVQVIKAYFDPSVDTSREPFLWVKPNLDGLVNFAVRKFGWSPVKSENILKPILKRIGDNYKQKTIKNYFSTKHKSDGNDVDLKISKRVKRAITKIEQGPNGNLELEKTETKISRKRKKKEIDIDLDVPKSLSLDKDVEVLSKVTEESKRKVQQIESELKNELDRLDNKQEQAKKPRTIESLHKKEVIPQKVNSEANAFRSRLKAIEVFRKSKRGPGFVQKKKAAKRKPKEDAELSESSSD